MRTPLIAKAITKARSKVAQKRGLPKNLVKAMEVRRQKKAEAKATPLEGPGPAANKKVTVRRRAKKEKAEAFMVGPSDIYFGITRALNCRSVMLGNAGQFEVDISSLLGNLSLRSSRALAVFTFKRVSM